MFFKKVVIYKGLLHFALEERTNHLFEVARVSLVDEEVQLVTSEL